MIISVIMPANLLKKLNNENEIRVGDKYQAVIPELIIDGIDDDPTVKKLSRNEFFVFWQPGPPSLSDKDIMEYIKMAKDVYNFNQVQALYVLLYSGYDFEDAIESLKRLCRPDTKWPEKDQILFSEAYERYRKNFTKYKNTLIDRKCKEIVDYYYHHFKKTLCERKSPRKSKRLMQKTSGGESNQNEVTPFDLQTIFTLPPFNIKVRGEVIRRLLLNDGVDSIMADIGNRMMDLDDRIATMKERVEKHRDEPRSAFGLDKYRTADPLVTNEWSVMEKGLLFEYVKKYGVDADEISQMLKSKTSLQVKIFFKMCEYPFFYNAIPRYAPRPEDASRKRTEENKPVVTRHAKRIKLTEEINNNDS